MTSDRTWGRTAGRTIFHRHLAGPETGHLGILGQTRQPLRDLTLDLRDRTDMVSLRSSSPRVSRLVCIRSNPC